MAKSARANSQASASPYAHIRRADVDKLFAKQKVVIDDFGTEIEIPDYSAMAIYYAKEVVAGREPACGSIRLSCKRFLSMLDEARTEKSLFFYSGTHVNDFMRFFEALPFVEDNWRGLDTAPAELFICYIAANIYGFRSKMTGHRWIKEAYLEIPRKHFKSGIATAVGLFDLITGKTSPQVVIAASTEDQAGKVFEPMKAHILRNPDLAGEYGLSSVKKEIRCSQNLGKIFTIASVAEKQDGHNPSTIILEELHAQKPDTFAVMDSSTGARAGQLTLMITTAGRMAGGVAWEIRKRAMSVLNGSTEDKQMFSFICTPDDDEIDDKEALLTDERIWIRCNPMWGVSLDPDDIRRKARRARDFPSDRAEFLRTRLNVWGVSGGALIAPEKWDACGKDIELGDMMGRKCWIGVDFSVHLDMTAIGLLFEYEDGIAVFAQHFLPEMSPTLADPNIASFATDWVDRGFLKLVPGARMRNGPVYEELKVYCEVFDVQTIAFDPALSSELNNYCYEQGLPACVYPNNKYTMTLPTDDLVARTVEGGLSHGKNPVLTWNAMNVTGERRVDDTLIPKKESANSWRKIDGFAALVFANGVRMNAHNIGPNDRETIVESPYQTRGLLGYEEDQ